VHVSWLTYKRERASSERDIPCRVSTWARGREGVRGIKGFKVG
jgi:hypothetical protein